METLAVSLALMAGFMGMSLFFTRSIGWKAVVLGLLFVRAWFKISPDDLWMEMGFSTIKQKTSVLVFLGVVALFLAAANAFSKSFRSFDRVFLTVALSAIIFGGCVFHYAFFSMVVPSWRGQASFLNDQAAHAGKRSFFKNCTQLGLQCAEGDKTLSFQNGVASNIIQQTSEIHAHMQDQQGRAIRFYFGGFGNDKGGKPYFASYTMNSRGYTSVVIDVKSGIAAKESIETGFYALLAALTGVWLGAAWLLSSVHRRHLKS